MRERRRGGMRRRREMRRRRRRRRRRSWVPDGRAGCLGKVLVAVALWPWRAGGGTDVRTFVCSDGRTDGRKFSPVFYRHRPLRVRCPRVRVVAQYMTRMMAMDYGLLYSVTNLRSG